MECLRLEEMEIQENVLLGPLTTLKIGGPARYFVRVTREDELPRALEFARERGLQVFVLGGGSNLVVADAGFDGLVLQVGIAGKVFGDSLPGSRSKVWYQVPAGVDWDDFVRTACEGVYAGVECLAGIPGTVGGSPVQNIGAYGQEVSQTIRRVRAFDLRRGDFVDLSAEECRFGYRRSIFNTTHRDRYIVTRVEFEFDLDAPVKLNYADLQRHFAGKPHPTPLEVYEAVRAIRASKGMLIDPENPTPDSRSAGSFFKNPVVTRKRFAGIAETMPETEKIPHWPTETDDVKLAAAWLIEQAGFRKGFALGRAGISSKHTLALINRTGDASCAELLRLRDLIVMTVEDRFRVTLEQEPVMLG
jgi:UDP-N-acetylmuramate dehydrogenase